MADASADLPQATSPDLRTADGLFHGLHGVRAAARTGGVIPAPGVRKCKRCGAPMHPDATHCPRGHARALERRVEEAIHLHRRGGGRYDPHLHPRDREGKFRDTPNAPDARTMSPGSEPRPDTPQQQRILRQNRIARKVRERFAPGTRVRGVVGGQEGTVTRHIPGSNEQGGTLKVKWDSGHEGTVSPMTVSRIDSESPRTEMPAEPPTARESARASAAAQDAIARANPNAIPEPSGPTAPGSLAGKDLSRVHPKAIDSELARLSTEAGKYEAYIRSITSGLERDRARDRQSGREPRDLVPEQQRHLERYQAKLVEVQREAQPFNDEFTRRGGWARYFLVTNGNGHVHKSMRCSTCFPTTEYAWLTDLAAKNEHQMVQQFGEVACSVCFPSAPSEYEAMKAAGQLTTRERQSQEANAARDAERARRAADKDSKAIANPDGTPLKLGGRFGETVRTLVTARKQLVDAINELRMWRGLHEQGHQNAPSLIAEHEMNVELLVAAIAHKLNVEMSVVRAEAEAKAAAKWRKETWRHG